MAIIEGRSVRIEGDGVSLEGSLHLPEGEGPFPGVVISHPHPQYGGDMYNNVVGTLVKAALAARVAALRYNFRGVGLSEGAFDAGRGEQADVRAALEHLKVTPEVDPARLGLAGYSFGAAMTMRAADGREDLRALIAVSAPTIGGPLLEVHCGCPILLVSGDRDEYSDAAALAAFEAMSGERVEVHVLPGVDHFWWGSDERLSDIVTEFLQRTLGTMPAGRN